MGLGTASALNSIVHDGLHESMPDFYPTLAAIQAVTTTQSANGELTEAWATAWLRYGNLAQRSATELRDGVMTRVPIGMALNLAGYYPEITIAHRVLIGSVAYNIAAVVHDSLGGSTRLELERTAH